MLESDKNKDPIVIPAFILQVTLFPMPLKSSLGTIKRGPMVIVHDKRQLERKSPKNIRLWTVSNDPLDLKMAIARAEEAMKEIAPMVILT